MTANDIRAALLALPLNEPRELAGIAVCRTPLGWSVNGQGVVALEPAVNVYQMIRRLRL